MPARPTLPCKGGPGFGQALPTVGRHDVGPSAAFAFAACRPVPTRLHVLARYTLSEPASSAGCRASSINKGKDQNLF
jgi:hypothetical protein